MRRVLLIAVPVLIVVALVVAQFVLPSIAADGLRSELEGDGASNVHVEVSAFPAIKLLWHKADSVTVTIGAYRSKSDDDSGPSLEDQLADTKDAGKLDVRVGELDDGQLSIHDVRLHKDGDVLTARVRLRRSDIDTALPIDLRVTGQSADGLTVSGKTDVFGESVDADASIVVDSGDLVLEPEDLGGLASVPIFSDDRVAVDSISASPTAGGYIIRVRGHLRG